MKRSILVKIHAATGTFALLLIATFFTSTLVVEIGGETEPIQTVKQWIVYGIGLLIPPDGGRGTIRQRPGREKQSQVSHPKKEQDETHRYDGSICAGSFSPFSKLPGC